MDPIPSILKQGVPVKPLLSAFHSYNSGTADGKRYCCRAYDPVQKRSRLFWQRRIDNELIREEPLEIQHGEQRSAPVDEATVPKVFAELA